jgi:hypothetical protein
MKKTLITLVLLAVLALAGCQSATGTLVDRNTIVNDDDACVYVTRTVSFDSDGGYVAFDGFDGAMTLTRIVADSETTLSFSAPRGSRLFQLVLVDSYDNIHVIGEDFPVTLDDGTYTLKLIGKGASGTVFVSISQTGIQSVTQ